jgi:ketosteroid isomerase-like protein
VQAVLSFDALRRLLLIAGGSCALMPAPVWGKASVSTSSVRAPPVDLIAALEEYNRATIQKDILTLARLVTDDYMLVNSDGSVQDKCSYLADFKMPGFNIDSYKIQQPILRLKGNAALTGGFFGLSWAQDGRRHMRRLRIVHFWNKQGRNWRISYTQLTRVID